MASSPEIEREMDENVTLQHLDVQTSEKRFVPDSQNANAIEELSEAEHLMRWDIYVTKQKEILGVKSELNCCSGTISCGKTKRMKLQKLASNAEKLKC